jgi:uncharacterized pyridoxamine 5'-phosphate oxidase family protein
MELSDHDLEFLRNNHQAAMITVGQDGVAKTARIGVALVDGKLWSSGTSARVRTKRLRRDPRCTLFVFDAAYSWLALETTVTILDGPEAPNLNMKLMRSSQDKPTGPLSWFGGELTEKQFLETMVEEGRLIYEFEIQKAYGLR